MNLEKLKILLSAKNKRHRDIAKILNISARTVHSKLTGKKSFKVEELLILAKELECSLDYLTG